MPVDIEALIETSPPPVRRLIDWGDPNETLWPEQGPFYPARLKLSDEHVPALIAVLEAWPAFRALGDAAVAADPDAPYPPRAGAFIHAWRALGQMGAVAAVGPMLAAMRDLQRDGEDDEWSLQEVPQALALVGPPAVDAIGRFLADGSANDWTRMAAGETLARIGRAHPDARLACVDALAAAVGRHADQTPQLNGSFVAALLDLDAVEAAPAIRAAFLADRVDGSICGGWHDVREALNIGPRPDDPPHVTPNEYRQRYEPEIFEKMQEITKMAERLAAGDVGLPGSAPHPTGPARDRKRLERKKERKNKKRNRRK